MKDMELQNRIENAVDTTLASLDPSAWQCDLLIENIKGGKKSVMGKKVSAMMVFAIVMMIVCIGTAFALITMRETGQQIAKIEQEEGFYIDWPAEKKALVIRALVEQGYIEETNEIKQMIEGKLNDDEISRTADEAIANLTGMDAKDASFLSIMQAVWGPFDQWSYEDRAWYSLVMESIGVESEGKTVYKEPEKTLNAQKAISIAQNEIAKAFQVEESVLNQYDYSVSYEVPEFAEEGSAQAYWHITFNAPAAMPKENRLFESIELFVHPETGELLESVDHILETWSALPHRPTTELYQKIDAFIAEGRALGANSFRYWPLELRAKWSQEIAPQVRTIVESGDLTQLLNSGNVDNVIIAQSTFTYGLPDQNSISQEKALHLAEEALSEKFNLPADLFSKYAKINVYYDITNESVHLWKFFFNPKELDARRLEEGYGNPIFDLCYKAEIDAYTGEVKLVDEFSFITPGQSLENDLKWY